MEKAVLKTLIYYDFFDFPLKAWEVHKWLTGKTASLKQVQRVLIKMGQREKIKHKGGYWFLTGRKGLEGKRLERELISKRNLKTAKFIALLFRSIPWVKLTGISGSLSMMGSSKSDDIDLFIITSKKRIWLSRFFLIILTSLTGLRRKRRENQLSAAGRICINLILESDNLEQSKKNIYLAHEVLQMRVLWHREDIYSKFLHDNFWAFKYLPNWKSGIKTRNEKRETKNEKRKTLEVVDWLEEVVKSLQLRIMNSPSGAEKINNGALYFHPEDKGVKILEKYKQSINPLNGSGHSM